MFTIIFELGGKILLPLRQYRQSWWVILKMKPLKFIFKRLFSLPFKCNSVYMIFNNKLPKFLEIFYWKAILIKLLIHH